MPLGDSITYGFNGINYPNGDVPGGYRRELALRLSAAGVAFDFVGSRRDNPAPGVDSDHNGYPGYRTDQILGNISGWLATNPDVVLMHLGTNDLIQHISNSAAINNLNLLIQQITANAPNRKLYVATIIPIVDTRDGHTPTEWAAIVGSYNSQVKSIVQSNAGQGRKVYLVDMAAGLTYNFPNASNNFFQPGDGTHPGPAGYSQMGDFWFDAMGTSTPVPPVAGPQLVVNGGFEADLNNWTPAGNVLVQPGSGFSSEGSKHLAFNAGNSAPNGSVSQSLATQPGAAYTLTFSAGVYAFTRDTQSLEVSVSGSSVLASQVVKVTGAGDGSVRWANQSVSFVANSTNTTLAFRDLSVATNALDLLLDNVRVNGATSSINTAPVATADSYSTNVNTPLFRPASGVLGNDTDAQGNLLTAVRETGPMNGTLVLNTDGSFNYTPMTGFSGSDSFSYHASDGSLNSVSVTVSISVTGSMGGILNSLVNGGFESGTSGWSFTGNVVVASGAPYIATEGRQLAAFNGGNQNPSGVLSQTINTTRGQTYNLAFDVGVLTYNTNSQSLLVTVSGNGVLQSRVISIGGPGGSRWQAQEISFVADGTAVTISFRDQSTTTNSIDLLIDHVRLSVPSAVAVAIAQIPATLTIDSPAPITSAPFGPVALAEISGGFSVSVETSHGCVYFLERSFDLLTWELASEKQTLEAGVVEFTDASSVPLGGRSVFYRIGHKSH